MLKLPYQICLLILATFAKIIPVGREETELDPFIHVDRYDIEILVFINVSSLNFIISVCP